MENILVKKENLIFSLKKKKEIYDELPILDYEKEIYILEPSKGLIALNDELQIQKELYLTLIKNTKEIKFKLDSNEKKIKVKILCFIIFRN